MIFRGKSNQTKQYQAKLGKGINNAIKWQKGIK